MAHDLADYTTSSVPQGYYNPSPVVLSSCGLRYLADVTHVDLLIAMDDDGPQFPYFGLCRPRED